LKEFKIALIQLLVSANKQENIKRACDFISIAAKNDAKIISLPVISSFC
jgi:predicted amidohydrolase